MRQGMVLLAWLAMTTFASAQFAVEKYLDDQAFLVARIRPQKVEMNKAIAFLTKAKVIPQAEAFAIGLMAGTVKASVDRNAQEIFIVYSMSMVSSGEFLPVVIVPTKDAEQQEKLEEMLKKLPMQEAFKTKRIEGALLAGAPGALERASKMAGKPRVDLNAAKLVWGDHAVQVAVVPTPDQKRSLKELVPPLQKPLDGHSSQELASGVEWLSMSMDPFPPRVKFVIRAVDSPIVDKCMAFLKDVMKLAPLALAETDKEMAEPAGKLAQMLGNGLKKEGNDIVLSLDDPQPILDLFLAGVTKARGAAQSMQSQNNMKQILLAFHNSHDSYGALPAQAITAKDGKPLLSWRVAILPYVEQAELYKKFKLDEPWDSENNKPLVQAMPKLFAPENEKLEPGMTPYVVPTGKNTLFPAGPKGLRFSNVTDGLSNTLALVQVPASRAVIWTKPDDWEADPKVSFEALMKGFDNKMIIGIADGSIRTIKLPVKEATLRGAITPAGGEVINLD